MAVACCAAASDTRHLFIICCYFEGVSEFLIPCPLVFERRRFFVFDLGPQQPQAFDRSVSPVGDVVARVLVKPGHRE